MSKNIWYITKYFQKSDGTSPGGRSFQLTRELVKKGFNVSVIVSDSNNLNPVPDVRGSFKKEVVDGLNIYWLNTFKYTVAKSYKRILSWFSFEWKLFWFDKTILQKPDVVIVSSLSLLTILNGILIKKKYGCKLVFEIRDIWPLTLVEEGGFSNSNMFVRFLGLVERIGYEQSDVIIGTMPNLSSHVSLVTGKQLPVHCVPMGIPDQGDGYVGAVLDKSYVENYIPSDKFVVGYAGTVGITNALEVLLECAKLMNGSENIHFVIVGDGALRQQFINEYGSLSNITFAPKVSKNQVNDLLCNFDLLYFSVYPSKVWDYGQSLNKVIDYMMAGKPILASYSGYPSMINESSCGKFVPAGDSKALASEIMKFSNISEEELEGMGEKGRDWLLKNRTYQKLADRYVELIS